MHDDDEPDETKDKDDKNVIYFPALEERQKSRKDKRKEDKAKEKLEAEYRAQYARERSKMARQSAGGKEPFINWEKVPLFVRYFAGTILAVHILVYVFVKSEDMLLFSYSFGFVPAYYTGAMEWTNFALIGPFTSIILHTGWVHIMANFIMFVVLCTLFEQNYGFKKTAALFFASAMCGQLYYFMYDPFSTSPVIGASGGISGLFGAIVIMVAQRSQEAGTYKKKWLIPFILIWTCLIVLRGLIAPGIAWQGHLGGFLGGLLLFHLWRIGKIRF